MPTVETLRMSLEQACGDAKDLFFASTLPKSREDYFSKGKLGDNGKGAVYVYFAASGEALYVGEASRPIKRQMHDQTSPHTTTAWWAAWGNVRFLQVNNRTDRLTLELLLILALKPVFDSKPGAREFGGMFATEI